MTFVSHSVCDVFQMVLLGKKTPSKQFVMPNEVEKLYMYDTYLLIHNPIDTHTHH